MMSSLTDGKEPNEGDWKKNTNEKIRVKQHLSKENTHLLDVQ